MGTGLKQIARESSFLSKISLMDKRKSPVAPPRSRPKPPGQRGSDSDASADTNSLSAESAPDQPKELAADLFPKQRKKLDRRRGSEWEILESLKDGQKFEKKPDLFCGYLHKKRKWPLKGWHKRFFILDNGILTYAKGKTDIEKGKVHGSIDIGLSVITTKAMGRRIDIDADEFIHHLKVKTTDVFNTWVRQLKTHRLHRQHLLTYGVKDGPYFRTNHRQAVDDDGTLTRNKLPELSRDGSMTRSGVPGGRLATWIIDSRPNMEVANKELAEVQHNLSQLTRILENLENLSSVNSTGDNESLGDGSSPSLKKDWKKFGLRKKKSSKGSSVDITANFNQVQPENASPSSNSLSALSVSSQTNNNNPMVNSVGNTIPTPVMAIRPQSLPGSDNLGSNSSVSVERQLSATPEHHQLREDFIILAKDVGSSLKKVVFTLVTERDKLKTALESDAANPMFCGSGPNVVANLRNSLSLALQQNSDLKSRLSRVHDLTDVNDLSSIGPNSEGCRTFRRSLSYSSSCLSASEFYDAEDAENLRGEDGEEQDIKAGDESDTSSDAGSLDSEEGSVSSENSGIGNEFTDQNKQVDSDTNFLHDSTGRRTKLPVPKPETEGLSLWNLLSKNIGKDLSQISMPVTLNEPLNVLQRLCEELEYSELLDKAAELWDPYDRMVYIAAFAVSSYSTALYRAGNKPFNPLLGETFECVREDKGFKFIAEQVSHHPPVSVCHAESRNFVFWQDARVKTKFWGKSMEFQPMGNVTVQLPKTGDFYRWNKVTTCVHNLFSGQRWVDQYGELKIVNNKISCKLNFIKASYWSAKRHEVHGAVFSEDGKVVRKLFGKWSEALYCGEAPSAKCIWRPGAMPENYELYYGFTRFAMELNELDAETAKILPCSDTRFRPDQRALEEGDLEAAERLKMQLEQSQRERRKSGRSFTPKWFSRKTTAAKGEEWEYNGKYWDFRKNPGFAHLGIEPLW